MPTSAPPTAGWKASPIWLAPENGYARLQNLRNGSAQSSSTRPSITRGIRYFEHPVSMNICEAFVKLQSGRIYEDYKLNHHHLWFMDKTFEAEILNVRAESKPSRDLMQDLQDIQSGIEIRYDAGLRKANKEQKSKKRAEAKAKKIQALERKLLEIGYENLESYSLDKVHADKWLEPERIQELTELREKRIEEEKNKPVQLSLPLEALLP